MGYSGESCFSVMYGGCCSVCNLVVFSAVYVFVEWWCVCVSC